MSEPSAIWREEFLSDAHGLAAFAVLDDRVTEANEAAKQLFGADCIGRRLDDLFKLDGSEGIRALASKNRPAVVELALKGRGNVFHEPFLLFVVHGEWLLMAAPSARRYTEEIGTKLTAARSDLANLTRELPRWIAELNSAEHALLEATEAEQRLGAELEELGHATSAVSAAVAALPESDVAAVLYTIALQARALTQADYVSLGIGTDPEQPFDPWIFIGASQEVETMIGRSPRPVGLLGAVARNGKIIRVGDLRREPLFRGFPGGHPEMGSFLGAPIAYRGRAVGNLYLANRPGNRAFSEKDERIIRMLATRVGVAIETARIYAGERFHRSWLQNIIDQMPNGVVLYDERGRLKAMNQAISNLSCEPSGSTDAYGNPIIFEVLEADGSAIPPDDLPMGRALCTQEATIHKEALIRPRDGRLVPVSLSAVPVRGPNGKVSGVTVLVEDITERKELERLREEWAAVVAHDLRQPASVITLAADVLLKLHAEEWSDADRRTVERIRSAAEHLNRLIADLTDASLVESKRLSVEPEVVDLEALVHSVVESLEAATAGYDVEIRVEGEPQAWVDPDRIRQVLVNLVTNAAKYGRRGTVIRVDLRRRDDSVEVTVTNEGVGIPPNDLDRLFVRFARTRGARKSKATGLGLGLYIARGIVEAHGGRIWAESIPGQTTAFHVRLPGHPPEVATGARDTGADS